MNKALVKKIETLVFCLFTLIFLMGLKVPKKNTSYIVYNLYGVNSLSKTEVNAISFPISIDQVDYPDKQIAKNAQGETRLVYSKDKRTMIFLLNDLNRSSAQFLVLLSNNKVISLHFALKNIPGQVIHVPSFWSVKIENTNLHKKLSQLNKSWSQNVNFDNDSSIETIMRNVFLMKNPGYGWDISSSDIQIGPYYPGIVQKIVSSWKKGASQVILWKVCSYRSQPLLISVSKLANQHLFKAITISHEKVLPGHCTYICALLSKEDNDLNKHFILSPYQPSKEQLKNV